MATILSRSETLDREPEEFAIVSTTFNNRGVKKFPGRPIAIVHSVRSAAKTLVKDVDNGAKSYYLSPHLTGLSSIFCYLNPTNLEPLRNNLKN